MVPKELRDAVLRNIPIGIRHMSSDPVAQWVGALATEPKDPSPIPKAG